MGRKAVERYARNNGGGDMKAIKERANKAGLTLDEVFDPITDKASKFRESEIVRMGRIDGEKYKDIAEFWGVEITYVRDLCQ